MSDDLTYAIETEEALRKLYEQPSKGAVAKEIRTIDTHCSNFIGLSPFILHRHNERQWHCRHFTPRG